MGFSGCLSLRIARVAGITHFAIVVIIIRCCNSSSSNDDGVREVHTLRPLETLGIVVVVVIIIGIVVYCCCSFKLAFANRVRMFNDNMMVVMMMVMMIALLSELLSSELLFIQARLKLTECGCSMII